MSEYFTVILQHKPCFTFHSSALWDVLGCFQPWALLPVFALLTGFLAGLFSTTTGLCAGWPSSPLTPLGPEGFNTAIANLHILTLELIIAWRHVEIITNITMTDKMQIEQNFENLEKMILTMELVCMFHTDHFCTWVHTMVSDLPQLQHRQTLQLQELCHKHVL